MPYYYWRGVALTGNYKKGRLFARSQEHLDQLLLKRHIALIKCKKLKQLFAKPIRLSHIAQFINRLSVLITAGVFLPDALSIVGDQIDHPQLQEIINSIGEQVQSGESFASALKQYPKQFNYLMVQTISAGEESGNLPVALEGLCEHINGMQEFYRKVRNALMTPLITVIFFLMITTLIFTVIMPRFVDIFASMQQEIPISTQRLLAVSAFMTSYGMLLLVSVLLIIFFILNRVTKFGLGQRIKNKTIMRIPIINSISQERFICSIFQSLSLLIDGGMPVVQALATVRNATNHHLFYQQLSYLENDLSAGSSLSDAMARHPDGIFSQNSIAMVQVGEESGKLGSLLKQIACDYQETVFQKLTRISFLLQPAIMLLLGLMVGLLIFAVYAPIFSLSNAF